VVDVERGNVSLAGEKGWFGNGNAIICAGTVIKSRSQIEQTPESSGRDDLN